MTDSTLNTNAASTYLKSNDVDGKMLATAAATNEVAGKCFTRRRQQR